MADNGISTLSTKELRQKAKLDLASSDRLAISNPRVYYDITQLPTQYSDNDIVDNPNTDGLVEGRPWIEIPPTPSYALEFRAVIGEGEPGDIITTCNEGDVIWFSIIGTNLPDDPTAYLQFSGATITNADGSWFAEVPINLVDPIPYPITGTVTNGAYLTIEADNLTEGNETLTLDWIVNGTTVATTSITIVDTSTGPTVTSFTSVGTTTWTAPAGVTSVEYLVVGGGGGAGNGYDNAGGGGAGGGMVLTGTLSVTPTQSYTITVGDGGIGGANARTNNAGVDGNNSVFATITALGGGAGKGSRTSVAAGAAQISNTTAPTGGGGSGGGFGGKGGGGSTGAGSNNSGTAGGAGGAGTSSSITGSSVTYGAGGAGANSGVQNGGANGSTSTGQGGQAGGATSSNSTAGGKGGSGVVILKY
jgi:hypothetical protein